MSITRNQAPIAVPVGAGVVTALVGSSSSFAVVLSGLHGVGATPAQAASGLLALMVLLGVATMILARRFRMPITVAWSTPGAALLAGSAAVSGGWPAAVGAFCVTGALFMITGLWPGLSTLIGRIPTPIAQAMLAGVLLPLCLAPITAVAAHPLTVAPILLCWLILLRLAPRWAVPAAFVVAAVVIIISSAGADSVPTLGQLVPRPELTVPHFSWQAVIGLAIPLYIVTMASQNLPGVAVMRSYDYQVPWRPAMLITGAGTILGAPFGGHAINLAAISAALAAAPEADPDRRRRWVAAFSAGVTYLVLGVCSAAFATLVTLAPPGVVAAVAGIALIPTLASSVAGAVEQADERIPAVITFLVAAAGFSALGISSAFWALVAGLVARAVLRRPSPDPSR
ncbi:benzoate/H(+) symporter BenE family transporter [Microlunatus soli]|uniref:Benzoate membrane transport protein n=1 Tax=Microlunatus soli TaxID=630515 RepID=A0A1H2AGE6_9ACTN|nr:benzoate/H(+) symporter BenE family transporter [Microlunatus soli]SDT44889.1 benzoate membrane transport protein [Microlunatus soli]